jgi:hypothetical protein
MSLQPIPIQFASGSWGGIVNGAVTNLTDPGNQPYALNAGAGQTLTMIFDGGGPPDGKSGDSLRVQVFGPNGTLLPDANPYATSPATLTLPATGTYTLVVGLDNMEELWAGTFTLCVLVTNSKGPI